LLEEIERDPAPYLNSIYLAVMFAQNGSAILVALVAEHYFADVGITLASVAFTLAYFVVVEAMSKTYGILHSHRPALSMAPIVEHDLSRVPIYREDLDRVEGILYAKDVLKALHQGRGRSDIGLRELVRPAHFVPESNKASSLLREMQREKFHMAIVIDEYGSNAGLVTLEDLLEELVGEIGTNTTWRSVTWSQSATGATAWTRACPSAS